MCGRFALTSGEQLLLELFGLEEIPDMAPRYNIAPTQPVAALREKSSGSGRELAHFRWGLIPSWAKDPAIGNRMINARSETAAEKPSFRSAIRRKRCLVVTDGFYEWKKSPGGRGGKQPYFIGMADKKPFAFGGIWETWNDRDGGEVESCAILTTTPNELLETIHDRMPVILKPQDYDVWLDGKMQDMARLSKLFSPFDARQMDAYPVSTVVNSPRNDTPDCVVQQAET